MSLLAAAAVTNDRVLAANRTAARQLRQLDLSYPGSALSSVHGSAIKRINGWREGPPLVSPPSSIRRLAFTLLSRTSVERKRISASWLEADCADSGLAGYSRQGGIYRRETGFRTGGRAKVRVGDYSLQMSRWTHGRRRQL